MATCLQILGLVDSGITMLSVEPYFGHESKENLALWALFNIPGSLRQLGDSGKDTQVSSAAIFDLPGAHYFRQVKARLHRSSACAPLAVES